MSPLARTCSGTLVFLLIVVGSLAATTGGATQATGLTANKSAKRLVVWNNNIENMLPHHKTKLVDANGKFGSQTMMDSLFGKKKLPKQPKTCDQGAAKKDIQFTRLLNYIAKKEKYAPDIFTVQQITNQDQLNSLIRLMETKFKDGKKSINYEGVIAISKSKKSMPAKANRTRCNKKFQTNAVIYRADRLTPVTDATGKPLTRRWQSDVYDTSQKGCRNSDAVAQERAHNVAVLLKDKLSKRQVAVASIHWPLDSEGKKGVAAADQLLAHRCAIENFREANEAVDALAAATAASSTTMKIVAGDANAKTSIPSASDGKNWWDAAKKAGYRDPIAEVCGQTKGSQVIRKGAGKCVSPVTSVNNRIDYILVRGSGGFVKNSSRTISDKVAGGPYSEHLAVTTQINF